jgi:hypothetical protein
VDGKENMIDFIMFQQFIGELIGDLRAAVGQLGRSSMRIT